MQEELLRFKFNQKYIFLDTETEGLNLVSTRPWQVAWLETVGNKIIHRHDIMIKWDDLNISDEAARVTGFDKTSYEARAIPPIEAWHRLEKCLYDPEVKIVGHNLLFFDIYILNVWRRAMGMPTDYSFLHRIIDTRSLATAIFKGIPVDHNNFTAWQYRMSHMREKGLSTSQLTMLKHYGIPFNQQMLHSALYDVEKNMEIFFKEIYDLDI